MEKDERFKKQRRVIIFDYLRLFTYHILSGVFSCLVGIFTTNHLKR